MVLEDLLTLQMDEVQRQGLVSKLKQAFYLYVARSFLSFLSLSIIFHLFAYSFGSVIGFPFFKISLVNTVYNPVPS